MSFEKTATEADSASVYHFQLLTDTALRVLDHISRKELDLQIWKRKLQ